MLSKVLKGSSRAFVEEWESVTHKLSLPGFYQPVAEYESLTFHMQTCFSLPLGLRHSVFIFFFYFLPLQCPPPPFLSLPQSIIVSKGLDVGLLCSSFSSWKNFLLDNSSFFFTLHLGRHSIN